ncbi:NAD(P)-binding domain-containing protein [Gammaproteobacteria bacterium]|nr:NAD(P)-binding domain-containing protein [Gammaproteobacteria bacterium]
MVANTSVPVAVIGAGHSGLSASYWLGRHGIEHVVIERGRVAESWREERWDSLRLLTPNWQNSLPGSSYDGDDPDGFMTMDGVIQFIADYGSDIKAPIVEGTNVTHVTASVNGYVIETSRGGFEARAVILASGACNVASLPRFADAMPEDVPAVHSMHYKNPRQLPKGPALVVGASATGLQLANEIHDSGRPVTISVGEHVRMPRTYRERDVQWWMHATGLLDDTIDDVDDLVRARNIPSPQLVGTPDHSTVDLNSLSGKGVELVGRLAGVRSMGGASLAQFSGSLKNVCALADLKLNRLLNTFDEWANKQSNLDVGKVERFANTIVSDRPELGITIGGTGGIQSVIWATGYKPDYSWLDLPVFDSKGRLRHEGGVIKDSPGVFILGLTFLRRRKSSFIHGANDDARELVDVLARYLEGQVPQS